jgi:hypothetical protein
MLSLNTDSISQGESEMPDTITHILFGEEALKRLPRDIDIRAFYLGCIGPDPMYYYSILPLAGSRNVIRTASAIHGSRGAVFIGKGREYIYGQSDPVLRSMLNSYLLGFLSHYMLDSSAHPYVNLVSERYANGHKRFEMNIDTLLLIKLKGTMSKNFNFKKYMKPDKSVLGPIADMFGYIADSIYTKDFDKADYIKSVARMRRICGMFQDPSGILLTAVVIFETLTGRKDRYRYLFYRMPGKDAPDYMNINKTYDADSFPDIFYRTLDNFIDVCEGKLDIDIMDIDFSGDKTE